MPAAVRLEPLTTAHLPVMEALTADPDVRRFTRIPDPPPPGFAAQWCDRYVGAGPGEGRAAFAVVAGDEIAGVALCPRVDGDTRTAELGYMLVSGHRGRGHARAALELLTRWAFDVAGMLRLELIISVENAASERVAAACGYVREGVLRSYHLKSDVREDVALWSRLPTD